MKNEVLQFIESNNYTLIELRGTSIMRLEGAGEPLEFLIEGQQYRCSHNPSPIEQEIINRIIDSILKTPEKKFIYYDFSLDNNE